MVNINPKEMLRILRTNGRLRAEDGWRLFAKICLLQVQRGRRLNSHQGNSVAMLYVPVLCFSGWSSSWAKILGQLRCSSKKQSRKNISISSGLKFWKRDMNSKMLFVKLQLMSRFEWIWVWGLIMIIMLSWPLLPLAIRQNKRVTIDKRCYVVVKAVGPRWLLSWLPLSAFAAFFTNTMRKALPISSFYF